MFFQLFIKPADANKHNYFTQVTLDQLSSGCMKKANL